MSEKLDPNQILIAEYNYALQTTSQANEDRVNVLNFLLANIGTLFAAITLPNITKVFGYSFFIIIFLGLFVVGIISLLELIKLRASWVESVKAMNKIKDFYIQNNKDLESAFLWKTSTIPKKNKKWSVAFFIALTIMLINSGAIASSVILFGLDTHKEIWYLQGIIAAIIALIAQLILWFKF